LHTTQKTVIFLSSFALIIVAASSAQADAAMMMGPTVEVLAQGEPSVPGPALQPIPPEELEQPKPKATPAPAATPPEAAPNTPVRKGVLPGSIVPRDRLTTWDLNLEGALGWAFPDTGNSWDDKRFTGFLRARAGILRVHDS